MTHAAPLSVPIVEPAPAAPARFAAAAEIAVEARGLRKRFGREQHRVAALDEVDLRIRRGEIVGVLGPNGAGKTTLVSILEGLQAADAGTVEVLGEAMPGGLSRIKHRLGVAVQHSVLPPLLQVRELLELMCALYPRRRAADELVQALGLEAKREAQYRHLSGGQQQRVAVALALIGEPELMFLDEPTSQLDPQARRVVWDLLQQQRERSGAGILVTTHQMEEAERLCDRVLILDHGRVIAEAAPAELIARHCPERRVEFATRPATPLAFLGPCEVIGERSDGLHLVQAFPAQLDHTLVDLMARHGRGELVVADLRVEGRTLEDVFLKLTGRRIRG